MSTRVGLSPGLMAAAALALTLMLTGLTVSGCTSFDRDPQGESAADPPIEVTDDRGETIAFSKPPQRIVSLASGLSGYVAALDEERLVGGLQPPERPDLELTPAGTVLHPQEEAIRELEPDLVLLPAGGESLAEQLSEDGIKAMVLSPSTVDGVVSVMTLLGEVTGRSEQAAETVQTWSEQLADIEAKTEDLQQSARPLVFVEVWDDPLMTVGSRSLADDLVSLAGGRNLFAGRDAPWDQVSSSELSSAAPDLIITTLATTTERLAEGERPEWQSLEAVEQERVYYLPPHQLLEPGPAVMDGVTQLYQWFHPEGESSQ